MLKPKNLEKIVCDCGNAVFDDDFICIKCGKYMGESVEKLFMKNPQIYKGRAYIQTMEYLAGLRMLIERDKRNETKN